MKKCLLRIFGNLSGRSQAAARCGNINARLQRDRLKVQPIGRVPPLAAAPGTHIQQLTSRAGAVHHHYGGPRPGDPLQMLPRAQGDGFRGDGMADRFVVGHQDTAGPSIEGNGVAQYSAIFESPKFGEPDGVQVSRLFRSNRWVLPLMQHDSFLRLRAPPQIRTRLFRAKEGWARSLY